MALAVMLDNLRVLFNFEVQFEIHDCCANLSKSDDHHLANFSLFLETCICEHLKMDFFDNLFRIFHCFIFVINSQGVPW